MTGLIDEARRLDSSRLISAATEVTYRGDTLRLDDPLGGELDVIGANEYLGWYSGSPGEIPEHSWTSEFDKPLVISEFGAGARYDLHGDEQTRWSEEYQAAVYRNQLRMLDEIPFLAGMTPWILVDFRSPRRPLPDIQDFFNRKGLISDRGFRKQAFFVLQEYYRSRE
jgi:beta-glucuronidase